MHNRLALKNEENIENNSMILESSYESEDNDDNLIGDHCSLANIVVKLFNKKVNSKENKCKKCIPDTLS